MIHFVCCTNDEKVLNEMLMPSLSLLDGKINYNLILIDTKIHRYKSAAQAFNATLSSIEIPSEDILVFVHHDIAFDDIDAWQRIVDELGKDKNQLIGFAGMSSKVGRTVSNLKDQGTKKYLTLTQIKEKTEVESLDECCFAMTKGTYDLLHFDEHICDHWHLYAVNLCYQAKFEHSIKSYVIPEQIFHKKTVGDEIVGGSLYADNHFLKSLKKMIKKYRKYTEIIYTPCYICSTSHIGSFIRINKTRLKNVLISLRNN